MLSDVLLHKYNEFICELIGAVELWGIVQSISWLHILYAIYITYVGFCLHIAVMSMKITGQSKELE